MSQSPKEIIENIKPFSYSQYKDISSYEKLAVYAACFLEDQSVTLSFNYICIAAFKFFPDKFCADDDFKEYPSVDRLNRTVMHMTIVSHGNPLLNGSAKDGYHLTKYGRFIGEQVRDIIFKTKKDPEIKAPSVDLHKAGSSSDYKNLISSAGFQTFLTTNQFDINAVWALYSIVPFTQIGMVISKMNEIKERAKLERDAKCIEYTERVLAALK